MRFLKKRTLLKAVPRSPESLSGTVLMPFPDFSGSRLLSKVCEKELFSPHSGNVP